jgi:hypothetical protein
MTAVPLAVLPGLSVVRVTPAELPDPAAEMSVPERECVDTK